MLIRLSTLIPLLFFLPGAFAASRILLDCEVLLGKPAKSYQMQVYASEHTIGVRLPGYFEGLIAGNTHSFDMALQGLRLTREEFQKKFAGKKVLLVGEGFGELLPALMHIGANVQAVDPLYALKDAHSHLRTYLLRDRPNAQFILQNLRDYLQRYGEYLQPALAQKLPFRSGSFDYVISHLLISNLFSPIFTDDSKFEDHSESIYAAVLESIMESGRVLKPDGEALHVISGRNARTQFIGKNGVLSPEFTAKYRMAPKLEFEMTKGREIPMEYSAAMGETDLLASRRPIAEISILTVRRK